MFVKHFSCQSHKDLFEDGNIILRTYSYYQTISDKCGDPSEFSVEGDNFSRILGNEAFILCGSYASSKRLREEFGEYRTCIRDEYRFFQCLEDKLNGIIKFLNECKMGKISYYDPDSIDPSSCDGFEAIDYYQNTDNQDIEHPIHIPFRKKMSFSWQKEVRLCFFTSFDQIQKYSGNNIKLSFFKMLPGKKQNNLNCLNSRIANPKWLSHQYIKKYNENPEYQRSVQFDNYTDFKDHLDNYETWNYQREYYIEARVNIKPLHALEVL